MSLQHPFYRNPFHLAHVQVGRVDMGVDYHGYGPICAIGKCRIRGLGGEGWPGHEYLLYELLRGRHAGKYIYVAEGIVPRVHLGEIVYKGHPVADFRSDAAPGRSPGIEMGWASPIVNETLAAQMGQTNPPTHTNTPAGLAFARFLHRIGAPAPHVGPGREYPV